MSILIRNIEKSFDNEKVLHGIDFEFSSSQVNMIIGGSGSGKTVLVKCMLGLLKPDKGQVIFDGNDILAMRSKELRSLRTSIGVLFQSAALFDSLSVFENVAFQLRMFARNMNKQQIRERVRFCLDQVNLAGKEHLYPAELSGGMKKRVGIARAISMNPQYLFCDEPNSGLDPKTAENIDELIQTITYDFGTTTVVISHDIKSVLNIGDHIMYIYKGHKEWEGTRQEMKETQNPYLLDFISTSGLLQTHHFSAASGEQ
jgi:phospholipid/cholesterol/gamma-HCH transport system ATP-binding protein